MRRSYDTLVQLLREAKALARAEEAKRIKAENERDSKAKGYRKLCEVLVDAPALLAGLADEWEELTVDGFAVSITDWGRLHRAKFELLRRIAATMGVASKALGTEKAVKRKARFEGVK